MRFTDMGGIREDAEIVHPDRRACAGDEVARIHLDPGFHRPTHCHRVVAGKGIGDADFGRGQGVQEVGVVEGLDRGPDRQDRGHGGIDVLGSQRRRIKAKMGHGHAQNRLGCVQ